MMINHRTERPPFTGSSPCTGNSHCKLCETCSRKAVKRKDSTFLVSAPGHGNACAAYKKLVIGGVDE